MAQRPAIVANAQFHIGPGQRQRAQPFLDMAQLGALGFQKPAPRRHVVEQLAHLHRGTGRMRLWRQCRSAATGHFQPRTMLGNRLPRGKRKAADRGDRWQRFATKPHGGDLLQIIEAGDLAGGMARHRQHQFIARETNAIVADADQAYPTLLQIDIQAHGTGIERILDQLLDHRGRAFDHLTGSNLVDQYFRQLPDGHVFLTASGFAKSMALKGMAGLQGSLTPSSVMPHIARERFPCRTHPVGDGNPPAAGRPQSLPQT